MIAVKDEFYRDGIDILTKSIIKRVVAKGSQQPKDRIDEHSVQGRTTFDVMFPN